MFGRHARLLGGVALLVLCPQVALAQSGDAPGVESAQDKAHDRDATDDPVATGAQTQDGIPSLDTQPAERTPVTAIPDPGEGRIGFEASTVEYDADTATVTATGDVVLRQGERSVRADTVRWNEGTGEIVAEGNVRIIDGDGNQLLTDRVELTDQLDAGAMDDLLLVLAEGGRLAAVEAARGVEGDIELTRAAYSACSVQKADGCSKKPSWRITAERVVFDESERELHFKGAYLELFGARLVPLPGLTVTTDGRAISGVLVPDVRFSESNGIEISDSYYLRLDDNRDLLLSGYVFTEAPPMVSGQYRHLTDLGAFQATAYATYSERQPLGGNPAPPGDRFRGYLFTNGKFQFDENWSLSHSTRIASDRTFLRRYDISREDRLRSNINAEYISENTYLTIAGWATQTLRAGQDQGQIPIALPAIDFRTRMVDPIAEGQVTLQLNSLNIVRVDGQDTRRAFAKAQWDWRRITSMGQEVTLTALLRGDVYHSQDNADTVTALYRGLEGWQTRGIATAAVDVKWPFVAPFLGGTQVLSPRVQLVASPQLRNLAIPNEDSRAIDLETSNLFALNRFPGYDRVEDGVRVNYGFDWRAEFPGWRIFATLGQSYRLSDEEAILPDGTGLSGNVSDFVGRTELRYSDFVKLTHRFRLDKDNLAVRRNEFDATIGSSKTYAEIGYLRLDRNVDLSIEDLRDREELRLAGRVAFADYWSVFGSMVANLTNRDEDPTLQSDGFDLLRSRLGLAYRDDCLELGITWRRDYVSTGDAVRGNTFIFGIKLLGLGIN
ncbi:LPS-assembly protein LptD [Pseudoblastomonas halimionae]|uniref:LPS-assembly protein LptD n=1 Tax=Alteriqipengyuania halimionae TaxID=1926630 RepID=A0A6I4U647_9SPHN|nr:LPS assembly protein LptD [Alteriqipengyuania halimionae]MXP09922.1 LPS assembly protein LptD [Alteriqipengyuania halimionae]